MIIQSRPAVSKTTHRASPAKITAGDGSHPPLTKPAAEPGVGECLPVHVPVATGPSIDNGDPQWWAWLIEVPWPVIAFVIIGAIRSISAKSNRKS